MPFKKFAHWNFLGAIGWAFFWIGIGWVGGSLVNKVENITRVVGTAFLIFFLISVYIYYQRNKNNLFATDVIKDFADEI
jgi:membrane protein DedA with SNARE-associated domain